MITNFNISTFPIILFIKSIYMFGFTSTGVILMVLWYVLLYLLTMTSTLSMYTYFDIEVMYLWILLCKVLTNFYVTTDFSSLCVKYISIAFCSTHDFIDLL